MTEVKSTMEKLEQLKNTRNSGTWRTWVLNGVIRGGLIDRVMTVQLVV